MSQFSSAAARGVEAVRHNAKPFLLVQGIAVLLAAGYYVLPGAPAAMASVAQIKRDGGLPLSALATAIAGAIFPEIARVATGRKRTGGLEMGFQLLFFGTIGILIDLTYRIMGLIFGNDPNVATVAKKVVADQLIFAPFISIPFSTAAFAWKDSGFSVGRTANSFRAHGGFVAKCLPTLVTCWGFWAPVLIAVYAMPGDLQFPLFLAAQTAWSLLLLHLNDR